MVNPAKHIDISLYQWGEPLCRVTAPRVLRNKFSVPRNKFSIPRNKFSVPRNKFSVRCDFARKKGKTVCKGEQNCFGRPEQIVLSKKLSARQKFFRKSFREKFFLKFSSSCRLVFEQHLLKNWILFTFFIRKNNFHFESV